MRLYAARDKNTGKLVSGITNPSHKFWQRQGDWESAIRRYNCDRYKRGNYDLELVTYELVEVKEGEELSMNSYSFEVAHGYQILFGCVTASSKEEAEQKILNQDWDDIIDEYDSETLTEGYEIVDIWWWNGDFQEKCHDDYIVFVTERRSKWEN